MRRLLTLGKIGRFLSPMYCFACTLSLILSCARSVVRVFFLAIALSCAFSLGRILSCTRSGEDWMISLPQVLFRVYYPAHFLLRAFFPARAFCCTHFLLHTFYLALVLSCVRCYLRVLLTQAFDCFFFLQQALDAISEVGDLLGIKYSRRKNT